MPRSLRLAALIAIFLVAALVVPAGSAADPALLRMADPESNFVIGIDVQALMTSPLAQEAILKAQSSNPDWKQTLGALGPNPLSRIQEILIVGDMERAREESKGLILIRGDFADDSWIEMVCQSGCKSESYQGFTLQGLQNADKPGSFVRLDSNYVALGSPDQVRAVVDRRLSVTTSSFASRVGSWTSNTGGHHIWISAKGPFPMPNSGAAPMGMNALGNLDAFGMGLTLGTDLKVGMELRSFTPADSVALHQTLQGLLMMFSASAQSDPDTAQLLQGLSIHQSAQSVTAALHVPGSLLQRMAAKNAASVGIAADTTSTPAERTPKPQQPRQGIIRIEGLDGGPVVIESEQQAR